MEDYHADARVNRSGAPAGVMSALMNAVGVVALVAGLVLSVGGVEIARADPPQPDGDRYIRRNGEAIGTAVPAAPAARRAADSQPKAGLKTDVVEQTEQPAAAARPVGNPTIALNNRGYNYPDSLPIRPPK